RPHAGAGLAIPAARDRLHIDAGLGPEALFRLVGAAVVAARGEGRARRGNRLEGGDDVAAAADMGGIALRPDEDEVVVHDLAPPGAPAFGDEGQFRRLVMDEEHIGIAALADLQRLAGADGDDAYLDPALRGEGGEDRAEDAGILGRCRRGDDDEGLLLGARDAGRQREQGDEEEAREVDHLSVPRFVRVKARALTATDKVMRTNPKARASGRSPRLVSSAIAVVMVRVTPAMLPPTMRMAPTSAMARPKPARKAVRSPAGF